MSALSPDVTTGLADHAGHDHIAEGARMISPATNNVTVASAGDVRVESASAVCALRSTRRFALAALLLFAGVVHLAFAPEHLGESLGLGLGFLLTGIGQVALAPMLLRSPSASWLRVAAALSLSSFLALVAAVTVGLPILPHGEAMGPLGPVERLEDIAALTGVAELIAAMLAIWLLGRESGRPHVHQAKV